MNGSLKESLIDFKYRAKELIRPGIVTFCRLLTALHRIPPRYLFIMAHMRSGSTLMTHILNSHPDFIGYAESNSTYRTQRDLEEHRIRVHIVNRDFRFDSRYVVEQVNHNRYVPDLKVLTNANALILFLIRRPEDALPSIMRLPMCSEWVEKQALDYYINRLARLTEYASEVPEGCRIFITYDQLLDRTQEVFTLLQDWTNVQTPFSENYERLHTTGMKSDPSPYIAAGRIQRQKPPSDGRGISVDVLDASRRAYRETCGLMRLRCRSLDSTNA